MTPPAGAPRLAQAPDRTGGPQDRQQDRLRELDTEQRVVDLAYGELDRQLA